MVHSNSGGLSLEHYRDLISLEEPFARAAADPVHYEHLVQAALAELGMATDCSSNRQLLRDALTVRAPTPLTPYCHGLIDTILQTELAARPAIVASSLDRFPFLDLGCSTKCALWQGDITTLQIDAIVNAANSRLLGCFRPNHRCIDNAIHAAAGPRLREDCATIIAAQNSLEPTGLAKATRAYNLPSRFVLHTVGPIVDGDLTAEHEQALRESYTACLETAAQLPQVRTLAFCGVSTGVFGFPLEPATRIAVQSVRRWLAQNPDRLELVVFDVFSARDRVAYEAELSRQVDS